MSFTTQFGPSSGSLVIVGGGMNPEITERFIQLAGGPEASIVVIPTAETDEEIHMTQDKDGVHPLKAAGANTISILHTRDREVADSEEFVLPIRKAMGIWFTGGRHWRLTDAYLNTLALKEFHGVLQRGGVIGGSSAGATVQGLYMVRGDTNENTIMMGDHEEGFGFIRNVTIDQHLLTRNRQFDLIEVIEAHPDLLGIGIDEKTGIVVMGDTFEVIGRTCIAVYDHERLITPNGRFYFLMPGDTYNMKTKEAHRITESKEPFERISNQKWPK